MQKSPAIKSAALFFHPEYAKNSVSIEYATEIVLTNKADIGLIKLSRPAPPEAMIASFSKVVHEREPVLVAGFGAASRSNLRIVGKLKLTRLRISATRGESMEIRQYQSGVCRGDSGAAIFGEIPDVRVIILGVLSSSGQDCLDAHATIVIAGSKYHQWIWKTINSSR